MKRILKVSLMLAVILTAMGAHADEIDFALFVKNEIGQGKKVSFAFNQVKKVELSLYDSNEKMIHTETVSSKESINRTYDLNQLPEGTYYLEAETALKVARYKIRVVNDVAILSKKAISEVYKPVLVKKEGAVSVTIQNPENTAVSVIIYDGENNEVYNADLTGTNVTKTFDISRVSNEDYTFVMNYGNKTFVETVVSR